MAFDHPKHSLGSGSYDVDDVIFLLKPVAIEPTGVEEKERLIQSGQAHYSSMISTEFRPDADYMRIFDEALYIHEDTVAVDILKLANRIKAEIDAGHLNQTIALCSLVRAGVPFGILLKRALQRLHVDVYHYGVSIIRDKGLDLNAMRFIEGEHPNTSILFVDGWTGKGAISKQLTASWKSYKEEDPRLVVLADPAGYAWISGSYDDWLIPSGLLGANISGLISRSILRSDIIGPEDFHGAMHVADLQDIDLSRDFIERIDARSKAIRVNEMAALEPEKTAMMRVITNTCINAVAQKYDISNINRIKPGIAEATRAVLRRKPYRVLLRSHDDLDLSALQHLCRERGVQYEVSPSLTGQYRAMTIIEKVS